MEFKFWKKKKFPLLKQNDSCQGQEGETCCFSKNDGLSEQALQSCCFQRFCFSLCAAGLMSEAGN